MSDRKPTVMSIVFDDGMTMLIGSDQMVNYRMEVVGSAVDKDADVEIPEFEDLEGLVFELQLGFVIPVEGLDLEAPAVDSMILPNLIEISPEQRRAMADAVDKTLFGYDRHDIEGSNDKEQKEDD